MPLLSIARHKHYVGCDKIMARLADRLCIMLVLLASAQDSMLAIGMFMLEYFMKQECWQLAEELFAKTSMVWSCVSVKR